MRGLCGDAGCAERSGDSYRCPSHTARARERVAKHRALLRTRKGEVAVERRRKG